MIRIYVARHGETTWNAEMRIQGRSDPGLSPKGQAQSLVLLHWLKEQPISAIYTSTLQRTVQTVEPLASYLGLPIQRQPELDEMSFGAWEGKQFSDFDQRMKEEWERFRKNGFTFRGHQGENYTDVANRLKPFVDRVLRDHEGQEILIVGHRAANRMLIGLLLEWPLAEALRIEQGNDCVYSIRRNGEVRVSHFLDGTSGEGLLLANREGSL